MKKIIVILLVAALLIPSFVVAETTETESASPNTVTRAEFARIVCELTLSAEELEMMRNTRFSVRFDDVTRDHWGFSYIHYLNSQHIIHGHGMWQFSPDAPILIEEATVILIRALGIENTTRVYQPNYPYIYFEIAEEIGLIQDIAFLAGEYATRGILQSMIDRVAGTFEIKIEERAIARVADIVRREIALAEQEANLQAIREAAFAEYEAILAELGFASDEYATLEFLYNLVNSALDAPMMQRWSGGEYRIMDGTGHTTLITLRNTVWDNTPAYFDGENFIIKEEI